MFKLHFPESSFHIARLGQKQRFTVSICSAKEKHIYKSSGCHVSTLPDFSYSCSSRLSTLLTKEQLLVNQKPERPLKMQLWKSNRYTKTSHQLYFTLLRFTYKVHLAFCTTAARKLISEFSQIFQSHLEPSISIFLP